MFPVVIFFMNCRITDKSGLVEYYYLGFLYLESTESIIIEIGITISFRYHEGFMYRKHQTFRCFLQTSEFCLFGGGGGGVFLSTWKSRDYNYT